METEMESLHNNHVWDLVELPEEQNCVGSKWVYKVKVDGDGHID